MTWKTFTYLAPTTLDEALGLLSEYGREARVLAGGTDLLLRLKGNQYQPRAVVNIKRIPGLDGIDFDPQKGLRLGALVTVSDLLRSETVQAHYPVLIEGARVLASVQIRNLATVGGNLCNGAPSADLAPPLIALNGSAVIVGPEGERQVPLETFFVGPGQTVLKTGELLRALTVPPPQPSSCAVYLKHSPRRAMDIAVVGVAVAVAGEAVRIVLGAVAPTPLRARQAEALLRGQEMTESLIEEAAQTAAQEAQPIDDVRGTAWYRRKMVAVLVRRGLKEMTNGQMKNDK